MSIETLLEAARFLELQAQQQKTREEYERRDELPFERGVERRKADVERVNNVLRGEGVKPEMQAAPALLVQKALPPPATVAATTTVVVSHVVIPAPTLSPLPHQPAAAAHSPGNTGSPPLLHPSPAAPAFTDPHPGPTPVGNPPPQHLQSSVLTIPPHHFIQQSPLPQQPGSLKPCPLDDGKPQDQRRRPGGAGTREVHNKLEKNRRAHLKECFETLKKNIPNLDEKKTSNLSVLRSALRYIQTLKRKEKEYEHEMERLAREKIASQHQLAELKKELSQRMDVIEVDRILRQAVQLEDDQCSTSTASEGEDNVTDDIEDTRPMNALARTSHQELLNAGSSSSATVVAGPSPLLTQHLSLQQKQGPSPAAQVQIQPQALLPAQTHLVAATALQPTVIAHAAGASHASVIQAAVNHHHHHHLHQHQHHHQGKHVAHIAPATVQLAAATTTTGHITVHRASLAHLPHLGQHLCPQPLGVNQPAVGHLAHATVTHQQVNGAPPAGTAPVATKQVAGAQVVHQQLVGQPLLNPVTMVTMPSFPISTLKLA
ncbi:max-binding protein MNT [Amblyraja radiata]|uniref:max-binding protein MNT n=1 Tax=Amblyraja radiata TaxID=386614 RepID=UPI0014035E18|nr:max-binding protein MNT [Amblyraja radiata]